MNHGGKGGKLWRDPASPGDFVGTVGQAVALMVTSDLGAAFLRGVIYNGRPVHFDFDKFEILIVRGRSVLSLIVEAPENAGSIVLYETGGDGQSHRLVTVPRHAAPTKLNITIVGAGLEGGGP